MFETLPECLSQVEWDWFPEWGEAGKIMAVGERHCSIIGGNAKIERRISLSDIANNKSFTAAIAALAVDACPGKRSGELCATPGLDCDDCYLEQKEDLRQVLLEYASNSRATTTGFLRIINNWIRSGQQ